jgi:ureidoacrylate peracid hydrolase
MDPYADRALFGRPLALDPRRTAVVVIDMLNDFCVEPGKLANPAALNLCPAQNSVLNAARTTGGTVIFVNEEHRPNLHPQREFAKRMTHTYTGTWGAQVVDSLMTEPSDIEVIKRRFSGFFQTDLDLTLRDRGITSVVLLGVLANICVRATAHDAFFQGYDVVVPADCVGSMSAFEQLAALYDIATHFGWVSDSAAVRAALTDGRPIINQVPNLPDLG